MKKLLTLLAVVGLSLGVVGCGDKKDEKKTDDKGKTSATGDDKKDEKKDEKK